MYQFGIHNQHTDFFKFKFQWPTRLEMFKKKSFTLTVFGLMLLQTAAIPRGKHSYHKAGLLYSPLAT